jgi:hypothetical protein
MKDRKIIGVNASGPSGAMSNGATTYATIVYIVLAILIHVPEVELGLCVSLIGCELIPLHRLGMVLRDALAIGMHDPQVELGCTVSFLREWLPNPQRHPDLTMLPEIAAAHDTNLPILDKESEGI